MTDVATTVTTTDGGTIRPFQIDVPQEAVEDMRRRIAATRWPERETVTDDSQGVSLATMQALAAHWGTDYDWRTCEAKLNALPQFMTEIDGLDIHFIHVRSQHEGALPLIVTHGWPGSIYEFHRALGPLSEHFDLVVPALPGFGFSGKPRERGWGVTRIAAAFDTLMSVLGYERETRVIRRWNAP